MEALAAVPAVPADITEALAAVPVAPVVLEVPAVGIAPRWAEAVPPWAAECGADRL